VYAAFVYIRGVTTRRDQRPRGLAFLSALAVGAPLIGAFGAAYGMVDVCIGIANKRPSATLIMLAPGFAEATLCITLGLLAAAIAVVGHRHLEGRLHAPQQAKQHPAQPATPSTHPAHATA
jgi:biopolymer transport protein ExbB/TolQ